MRGDRRKEYDDTLGQGHSLAWRGDWQNAAKAYQRAAALQPQDASARAFLALCLVRLSRFPQALAELQAALQRDPANSSLLHKAAELQEQMGEPRAAAATLNRLADLLAVKYPTAATMARRRAQTLQNAPESRSSQTMELPANEPPEKVVPPGAVTAERQPALSTPPLSGQTAPALQPSPGMASIQAPPVWTEPEPAELPAALSAVAEAAVAAPAGTFETAAVALVGSAEARSEPAEAATGQQLEAPAEAPLDEDGGSPLAFGFDFELVEPPTFVEMPVGFAAAADSSALAPPAETVAGVAVLDEESGGDLSLPMVAAARLEVAPAAPVEGEPEPLPAEAKSPAPADSPPGPPAVELETQIWEPALQAAPTADETGAAPFIAAVAGPQYGDEVTWDDVVRIVELSEEPLLVAVAAAAAASTTEVLAAEPLLPPAGWQDTWPEWNAAELVTAPAPELAPSAAEPAVAGSGFAFAEPAAALEREEALPAETAPPVAAEVEEAAPGPLEPETASTVDSSDAEAATEPEAASAAELAVAARRFAASEGAPLAPAGDQEAAVEQAALAAAPAAADLAPAPASTQPTTGQPQANQPVAPSDVRPVESGAVLGQEVAPSVALSPATAAEATAGAATVGAPAAARIGQDGEAAGERDDEAAAVDEATELPSWLAEWQQAVAAIAAGRIVLGMDGQTTSVRSLLEEAAGSEDALSELRRLPGVDEYAAREVLALPSERQPALLLALARAEAFLACGMPISATDELETAIAGAPDFLPAQIGLARVYQATGRPEPARVKYQAIARVCELRGESEVAARLRQEASRAA
ncbi:MAG: tetratricopeptide repeat protein [Chloroflexi bacterium]|nr:tetratricopeptide repeat protein [Chloroflexota bacterium]MCL5110234.1 tetratricopeptide repeat protein [Chloroflexota bacterium]